MLNPLRHLRSSPQLLIFMLVTAISVGVLASPPLALAAGCGPGVLGSATEWKDRNLIYDFVSICDWHDRCYAGRGFGYDRIHHPDRANVPYPKDWCDSGFLAGMNRSCDLRRRGPSVNRICHAVASAFSRLVRVFGGPSYRSADGRRKFEQLRWPA